MKWSGPFAVTTYRTADAPSPGIGRKTAERMVLELRDKFAGSEVQRRRPAVAVMNPTEEDVLSAAGESGLSAGRGGEGAGCRRKRGRRKILRPDVSARVLSRLSK